MNAFDQFRVRKIDKFNRPFFGLKRTSSEALRKRALNIKS